MERDQSAQVVRSDRDVLGPLREAPIVTFGASGFLGRHLLSYFLTNQIRALGTYRRRKGPGLFAFDLEQEDMNIPFIPRDCRYAIIVSGNGDIDYHKTHRSECRQEVYGTRLLIDALVVRGITPVYLSTDYVFEGTRGNYRETDQTVPTTVYGKNRLAIERHLTGLTEDHLIVRVGKVYGTNGDDRSMIVDIATLLRRGEEAMCAHDQVYSPTVVNDVVIGVVKLMGMDARGTFHLSSPEFTSPYELAHKIKSAIPGCAGRITRVSIDEIILAERRPLNTTLNAEKLAALVPMSYRRVDDCLAEIAVRYS